MITDIKPASQMKHIASNVNLQKEIEKLSLDENIIQTEIDKIMCLIKEAAKNGNHEIEYVIREDDKPPNYTPIYAPKHTYNYAKIVALYLESIGGYKITKWRNTDETRMNMTISW